MKLSFNTSLFSPLLICFVLCTSVLAQDEPAEKPRKYKHDFEGQDLSNRDFSKKNLDDANFSDCILTNTNFEGASLKNCNFQGTKIESTNFSYTDMTGTDFRNCTISYPSFTKATLNNTNFAGVNFNHLNTHELKFRGANLRGAKGFNQTYGTDYYGADFRGADFSTAVLLNGTNFRKVKYDQFTRWPTGFDTSVHGLVYTETKEEEMDEPKTKPKGDNDSGEAEFQNLDKNEDGVLSGAEMKDLKDKDANEDGEITLAEFLSDK